MTLHHQCDQFTICLDQAANDPCFSSKRPVCLALVADNSKQPTQASHSQETTRGYTGHEHIDAVGIIHMNGRIYDPKLARCLQADPIVQASINTQSQSTQLRQTRAQTSEPVLLWARRSPPLIAVPMSKVSNAAQGNTGRLDCARLPELGTHYSYVWNNPLNNTDPSGYVVFSLIVGVALASSAASLGTTALIVSSFVGMTLAGTMDALMAGASIGQALRSGFISGVSAAAFAGIGRVFANGASTAASSSSATARMVGHITAHAAVGGITEVARGGKFGHGFLSAGITKGVFLNYNGYEPGSNTEDVFNHLALHAVVGGTSSKISGGKFANGAKTAAYQFLFNEWASKWWKSIWEVDSVELEHADPDHQPHLEKIHSLAVESRDEVDARLNSCVIGCKPWLRGTFIHNRLANKLKALGHPYNAEQSYLNGRRDRYVKLGTIRADATYGDIEVPEFVVELKTGNAQMTRGEAKLYHKHLPNGTDVYPMHLK